LLIAQPADPEAGLQLEAVLGTLKELLSPVDYELFIDTQLMKSGLTDDTPQDLWEKHHTTRDRMEDLLDRVRALLNHPVIGIQADEETHAWQRQAECREMPVSLFFPERGQSKLVKRTRQFCGSCAVSEACGQKAEALHTEFGIWDGKSGKERRLAKRALAG
jgi:hypothetical protein